MNSPETAAQFADPIAAEDQADQLILCNGSAVQARIITDTETEAPAWDRLVILSLGVVEADGTQHMVAGIALTAEQADQLAQELLDAGEAASSGRPLPIHTPEGHQIGGRA